MPTRRDFLTQAALALSGTAWALGSSETRIRIGQIGTAHSHALGKMEAVRSLPELYEVVGIAEPDEKVRAMAEKQAAFAGLKWMSERELMETPELRAVIIESNLDPAAEAALRAIRVGKHVHLDKPGAANHSLFQSMRLEAEKNGVTVQMGYMLRYNPAFELLFKAVRQSWLGEITEVDASMGKLASDSMRKSLLAYPGAGMFELGCHLVDAVVTILGKPQAVHAFPKATRKPDDAFPDNPMAVLEYAKATAVIRCNHADPHGGPRRRFYVAGTKGALEIAPLESGKANLFLSEPQGNFGKGENKVALKLSGNRYADEFRDLARVIRGEKRLTWTANHDITVHETALRAAGAWKE
jgi:predicted dehydrogenase